MFNPFKKFFKVKLASVEAPEAPAVEEMEISVSEREKVVTGHGYEIRDGISYMWKKFDDGSEDIANQEALRANPSDADGTHQEVMAKRKEWGLEE
jgi:hypothetical protein